MGQLLQVNNGVVSGVVGADNGALVYFNGTSWVALEAGALGQVLTINSSGNPVWSLPPQPGNWKALR